MLVDRDSFSERLEWFSRQPVLAVDTETTGLDWAGKDRVVGISIGAPPQSDYFPFRHGAGENLPEEWISRVIDVIQRCPLWLGWNTKFDLQMLSLDGYVIPKKGGIRDVQLAAWLNNENEMDPMGKSVYALKRLADRYLGPDCSKDEEELREVVEQFFGKKGKYEWKGHMWRLPAHLVSDYAEADVQLTWRMEEFYRPRLEAFNLQHLYDEFNDYMLMFAHMELEGVIIDQDRVQQLWDECTSAKVMLTRRINELSGGEIKNPTSSKQVNSYFGREHTIATDLTRELANDPVAQAMSEYRSADRAISSYYKTYAQTVKADGKVHASYNLAGTHIGRLSCSNPNLMGVPRFDDKEAGSYVKKVKQVFVAESGTSLVEIDMSQQDLRLASHYGARVLQHTRPHLLTEWNGAYLSPMGTLLIDPKVDLHQETANLIGVNRDTAKRINFSAVFGIGPKKYSDTYGVPFAEAKLNLSRWRERFPEFMALLNACEDIAITQGRIILDSGRIRRYPQPETIYQRKNVDPRKASSHLVAGSGADIMRRSGLDIWNGITEAFPMMQVHDSWVFRVPEGDNQGVINQLIHEMTKWKFAPPLLAEAKVGQVWGLLRKL